jgi:hypothetical protein
MPTTINLLTECDLSERCTSVWPRFGAGVGRTEGQDSLRWARSFATARRIRNDVV